MTYVKPTTNLSTSGGPQASSDSDILVVDGVNATFGTAVQVSSAGYGVTGNDGTNTFEVLDAMPMGRAATQNSIEAASNVNFANEDFLTSGEISSLADGAYHQAGSDQT